MRDARWWPMRLAFAVLALLALSGCLIDLVKEEDLQDGGDTDGGSTNGDATSGPAGSPGPNAAGPPTVTMRDGRYDPSTLTVARNTTVRFVAEDGTHSVASTNGVYDQGDVPEGSSVALFANLAGSYTLQCRFHADMRMAFTVSAA